MTQKTQRKKNNSGADADRLSMMINSAIEMSRKKNIPASRVVSFRITADQYQEIERQCHNAHGESLMSVSDYARYSVLQKRTPQLTENPLARYRIAIAAQLAASVSDAVNDLENFKLFSYETQVDLLDRACQKLDLIYNHIRSIISDEEFI